MVIVGSKTFREGVAHFRFLDTLVLAKNTRGLAREMKRTTSRPCVTCPCVICVTKISKINFFVGHPVLGFL